MSKILPLIDNCSYHKGLRWIFIWHYITQTTWQFIKLFWCLIYTALAMVLWLREPNDEDIITYIEGTILGILIRKERNDQFSLIVEKCCLRLSTGKIESFALIYTKSEAIKPRIISFTLNGRERTERQLFLSVLFSYHTTSIHTKCHLFSNSLTEYILDKKMKILMPSTVTSIALHHGLVNSSMSPITEQTGWFYHTFGQLYMNTTTRSSCLEESRNFSVLNGHAGRLMTGDSPSIFARYTSAARRVLKQVMLNHKIPLFLLEPLLNHSIVHSTDHSNWKLPFYWFGSILEDRKCTRFEAFRTICFNLLFAKPTLNPIFTNKIRYMDNPFYRELYNKLKPLDKEFGVDYANVVTASIMY